MIEIGHPSQVTPQQFPESLVPLREDLKDVPVSPSHNVADARDIARRNFLVKEIAHRVDEDLPWALPAERLLQLFGHQSQIEALFKRMPGHTSEALREQLGIAEFAARTHLRASADRVPRGVRPFDGRPIAHRPLAYILPVTEGVTALVVILHQSCGKAHNSNRSLNPPRRRTCQKAASCVLYR